MPPYLPIGAHAGAPPRKEARQKRAKQRPPGCRAKRSGTTLYLPSFARDCNPGPSLSGTRRRPGPGSAVRGRRAAAFGCTPRARRFGDPPQPSGATCVPSRFRRFDADRSPLRPGRRSPIGTTSPCAATPSRRRSVLRCEHPRGALDGADCIRAQRQGPCARARNETVTYGLRTRRLTPLDPWA